MKITNTCTVEYREHMGTDLSVVNAARTSFGKESAWVCADGSNDYEGMVRQSNLFNDRIPYTRAHLKQGDANLIRFLALGYTTQQWNELADQFLDPFEPGEIQALLREVMKHPQHWAPFAHPHATLRLSMPVFLARQFVKHQVGGVWSEESRRYVDEEPEIWLPETWHCRPENVKQGSGEALDDFTQKRATEKAKHVTRVALEAYKELLELGVAPEEARTILLLNIMTTVTWTGSLLFWSRVVNQRVDSHAQRAAQALGKQISNVLDPLYPVSWRALTT